MLKDGLMDITAGCEFHLFPVANGICCLSPASKMRFIYQLVIYLVEEGLTTNSILKASMPNMSCYGRVGRIGT